MDFNSERIPVFSAAEVTFFAKRKTKMPPRIGGILFAAECFLVRGFLEQSLLELLLALDAVPRPRYRFEPLGVDLIAAADALAEAAFAHADERGVDHLQQRALVIALAEEEFFGVRAGGAVGDVLRRVFISGAAIGLRAVHRTAQLLLPCL